MLKIHPDQVTMLDKSRRMKIKNITVQKLSEDAIIPTKAHDLDAGWDLYSVGDISIPCGCRSIIKTGISMAIPEGFVGLIWPRSGLAVKNGIDVFAGVIDSGYRGEVGICLFNSGDQFIEISKGDRIAQILFQEVPKFSMKQVDSLNDSDRGEGGFGSTGI